MPLRPNLVVATAGHIDHGKSSLVRALTGTDTDRLSEEKKRGISIDLGFAHMSFDDGSTVSFVDVPGHENYVKNMLAGVSGVRAALLIVAANEGVKPQTREHLAICKLLGIRDGLIVITKADLAPPEQVDFVREQILELCQSAVFSSRSPIVVSSVTGLGLSILRHELQCMLQKQLQQDLESPARLPVDRSFALRGFGTVVTGTLLSGTIKVGDSLRVQPSAMPVRVRGLQSHGEAVEQVQAGQRAAVNLTGIDHLQIVRGMQLTSETERTAATFIDTELQWIDEESKPHHRQQYLLHAGTAELVVGLKLLDQSGTWGRIWLSEPAFLLPGNRFVLRRPSPAATVGGGIVLDAYPPRRLNRVALVKRMRSLQSESWPDRFTLWVSESAHGRRVVELVRRSGLSERQVVEQLKAAKELVYLESEGRVVSRAWFEDAKRSAIAWLTDFHAAHPELAAAPLAKAREKLDPSLARLIFGQVEEIQLLGDSVALANHKPVVRSEQAQALSRIERLFREAGYQPPSPAEVLGKLGDATRHRPLLESLIKNNRLVRLSEDVVMHSEVLQHIRTSLAAHKGRRFTVPEFKDWTNVSRKYAIPILEYLDRQRVTRRDGDLRIVL